MKKIMNDRNKNIYVYLYNKKDQIIGLIKIKNIIPENLHELEDNLFVTHTPKDYLYFAANLRGEDKESFNVLMNLIYFEKVIYEG